MAIFEAAILQTSDAGRICDFDPFGSERGPSVFGNRPVD